jgi:hypothetical protein
MGICKDQATTYLNRLGYNVVRVPQSGIEPLQLIGQQKKGVSILGGLDQMITDGSSTKPVISRDRRGANIEGQQSSKLDLSIGIGLLGTFIGAMGGNVDVSASYSRAKKLQFRFQDVLLDSVMPLDVGDYLRAGNVDVGNLVLKEYVLGRGRLYLITETIKTRSLTVTAEGKGGASVDLDVPAIKELLEGQVDVKAESERSSTVTYQGSDYLVFGFKAFVVGVSDGVLSLVSASPGHVALNSDNLADAATADPMVFDEGGLMDLDPDEDGV